VGGACLEQCRNGDGSREGWNSEGRGRRKKTGLVRTPKGSRPLRGTHNVEGGTGKNVIETLSFGVLAAMGWHVVWHCDVRRRRLKKKTTVVRMVQ